MIQAEPQKPASHRATKAVISSVIAVPLCGISIWFFLLRSPAPAMIHLPLTRQSTDYTCGAAALQSVLAYYGEDWREDALVREVKSNPEQGTNYRELVRFARSQGLSADVRQGMAIEDLVRAVKEQRPVIVAMQAWASHPGKYAEDWEDGHYCVVVGVDGTNVYFMDPSTVGNYTFIPITTFLERWHDAEMDSDGRMNKLVHFGIVFGRDEKPTYNPEILKPME